MIEEKMNPSNALFTMGQIIYKEIFVVLLCTSVFTTLKFYHRLVIYSFLKIFKVALLGRVGYNLRTAIKKS